MDLLILTILILAIPLTSFAQELRCSKELEITAIVVDEPADSHKYPRIEQNELSRIVTELGIVYVGMPKEDLARAGYAELIQKGYEKQGNEEWITYLNWTTKKRADLVTFYVVDGKVKGWEEKCQKKY